MLNKVILMGRLTKEPELKYTPSGTAVASFTIAVDRNYKGANGKYETDFINCVAWRGTAEIVANYFAKGQLMALGGSIQTRSYADKEGKTVYTTEVIADEVYFAESKKAESKSAAPKAPAQPKADFEETEDDDLPF